MSSLKIENFYDKVESPKDTDRYIYVILTQSGTNVCKLIKLFTRKPYNHASITCDSELDEMFSFSRLHFHRPLPAGFTTEKPRGGVFELFKTTPCEIYGFRVSAEQFERYSRVIRHFMEKNTLYSYNVVGLVALAFGIPIHRKNHFICSQFVAHVLQESGIVRFNKDLALIKPDDLRYMRGAELVYKGELKEYPLALGKREKTISAI